MDPILDRRARMRAGLAHLREQRDLLRRTRAGEDGLDISRAGRRDRMKDFLGILRDGREALRATRRAELGV